jgi:hypothetical protein
METIHPNNIPDIDIKSISLITLKNGNIIMIDDSAEEKPNTKIIQSSSEYLKKEKKFQFLSISEHLTYYLKGKIHTINKNDDKKKLVIKNDFNLVSKISKNINFSYYRKPKNNIQNLNKKQNMPKNKFGEKKNKMKFSKSLSNFNPIYIPQLNDKTNLNSKILLNDNKSKFAQLDESNYLSNDNDCVDEENKEEDINSKINKKKRNFIERIEKIVGERNNHTVKAVISLNIPCDNPALISTTEKQFNVLMSQLRGKQKKFKRRNVDTNYQKFYQLYKDNHDKQYNRILDPNANKIKYYQDKNIENQSPINQLKSLNTETILVNKSINNNTIYSSFNNKTISINKSINYYGRNKRKNIKLSKTSYSLNDNKNRVSSNNQKLTNKIDRNILGDNHALIFPCNNFIKKLDYNFI